MQVLWNAMNPDTTSSSSRVTIIGIWIIQRHRELTKESICTRIADLVLDSIDAEWCFLIALFGLINTIQPNSCIELIE